MPDEYTVASPPPSKPWSRSTLFAILMCILGTCLNILVFQSSSRPKVLRYRDLGRLRRPDPFIGLKRIQSRPLAPPAIPIFPNLISQISQTEPHRAFSDDPSRFATWGGMVAPEDRPFKVTANVSMIVEFRTVDYAMESCELSLVTPHETSANFTLSGEVNILDVWQLTTQYPLDAKTLSWKTRPECTRKIVSIAVGRGTNYTHRFPCPPDSLQTFQFSAGNNWTHVEWLQDHTDAIPVVKLWQHESPKLGSYGL